MDKLNGTAHGTIGAGTGFIVAQSVQADPTTTLLLVGIGGIGGLIPDIDIDGKLSNRITFSHTLIRSVAQLIGLMMIVYTILEGIGREKWLGIGVGLAIILVASQIKQRHMLTITGLGVLLGGIALHEMWLMLLGTYIMIASFIPHRSYTHSLVGIGFFAFIAHYFQASIRVDGVFLTCLLSYGSHLIADMRVLPFNKRGVKFFLPFSSKEF